MRILVAGGSGFIGTHLVKRLEEQGHDPVVFDVRNRPEQEGADLETVKKYVEDCDLVFHLAASPAHRLSVHSPFKVVRNNNQALETFAEACHSFKKDVIYASSFAVYHSHELPFTENLPLRNLSAGTPYAVSKMYCESLLRNYYDLFKDYSVIVLRPSNVWGPLEELHKPLQVLPTWVEKAKKGEPITVHGKETSRDFTYINDLVSGWMLAFDYLLKKRKDGKVFDVFNIAGGKEVRLLEVANFLGKKFGVEVVVEDIPGFEVVRWRGDLTKSKSVLGYAPEHDFWDAFERHVTTRSV